MLVNARAMGYWPRRAVDPGRWQTADSKAGKAEPFKPFDIRYGATRLNICLSGFQSCFYLVFSHYDAFIPPFWNGNVYSVIFCFGSM